tara:strand:+ start:14 stop:502 length:489 start_codon:yes stop_codon:yes gene_type:complete
MSQIEGYENYTIFENGKIINTKFDRELTKGRLNNKGYYMITLSNNGIKKTFLKHRLIAKAFIPNPDNKPCIDHINRNIQDNRIENLRWVSLSENSRNRTGNSNSGKQFISKTKDNTYKEGFKYRFTIKRPELKHTYNNKYLQNVIDYRNKFCAENDIKINDS